MVSNIALSLLLAIFSMLGYGIIDVLAFILSKKADPRVVPLWTTILSVIFIGMVAIIMPFPGISISNLMLLLIAGAVGVVALLSFYKGLNQGEIAVIVPLANMWPLISVIIGVSLLDETLVRGQLLGITLVLIGIVLVSFKYGDVAKLKFNKLAAGAKYAFITLAGWGIFYTIVGFLSKSLGGYWATVLVQALIGVMLFAYLSFSRVKMSFPAAVKRELLLFGVLLSFSFVAYALSSSYGYVAISAPITGASPLITVILGLVLLRQRIERSQAIGVLLAVIGIALISF